jgi:hypothetical protein
VTGGSFTVRDVSSTLVGYAGKDPQQLAAIAAFSALMLGISGRVTQSQPARITVIGADETRLVVQAGDKRLTFERVGVATGRRSDPPR